MNSFTYVFLTAVLLGAVLEYWLAARQSRHVQANADAVPDAFVGKISLAEHRKAANYTLARLQVGRFEIPVSAAVLLGGLWAEASPCSMRRGKPAACPRCRRAWA